MVTGVCLWIPLISGILGFERWVERLGLEEGLDGWFVYTAELYSRRWWLRNLNILLVARSR